jgi:hypothetical protein
MHIEMRDVEDARRIVADGVPIEEHSFERDVRALGDGVRQRDYELEGLVAFGLATPSSAILTSSVEKP